MPSTGKRTFWPVSVSDVTRCSLHRRRVGRVEETGRIVAELEQAALAAEVVVDARMGCGEPLRDRPSHVDGHAANGVGGLARRLMCGGRGRGAVRILVAVPVCVLMAVAGGVLLVIGAVGILRGTDRPG